MQDYMNAILTAAGAIPDDTNTALLIFDDLLTILSVDVNVTGMNSDIAVSMLVVTHKWYLCPAACLCSVAPSLACNARKCMRMCIYPVNMAPLIHLYVTMLFGGYAAQHSFLPLSKRIHTEY